MYRVLEKSLDIYCRQTGCGRRCGRFHPDTFGRSATSLAAPKALEVRPESTDGLRVQLNAAEPLTPLGGPTAATLDQILSSARRKISQELTELRIPSPVFLDEAELEAGERAGFTPWPQQQAEEGDDEVEQDPLLRHLASDSSEDEVWMERQPPSDMGEDEEEESVDALLKQTRPPADHFSNPLYRKADPLRGPRRHGGGLHPATDEQDASSVDLSVADVNLSDFDDPTLGLYPRLAASPTQRAPYEQDL